MSRDSDHNGMLVCFEGGDAAGKSTLAASVTDQLRRQGLNPVMVDKKSAEDFRSPYLNERMATLRKALWDYPQDAPLWEWGDHHWFHLIVSWFSVLDQCKVQPLLNEGRIVIVDNWYYKFASRFLLKPDFDRAFIFGSFAHLTSPDIVIFIDVNPRVAVTRRERFSPTEAGKMDGYANGGAEDFVSYQDRVLEQMRTMCNSAWVRLDGTYSSQDSLVASASSVVNSAAIKRSFSEITER